jgi:hypothetical protein
VGEHDSKRRAFQALADRVRNGAGRAPASQRARAFDGGAGLPPPLDALAAKVASGPTEITEADFAAAKEAGFSEDEIFEVVVSAAVGQAARLYDAGLAALAEATAPAAAPAPVKEPDHAA